MKMLIIFASCLTFTTANAGLFSKNNCNLKIEDKIITETVSGEYIYGYSYDGNGYGSSIMSSSELEAARENLISKRQEYLKEVNTLDVKCHINSSRTLVEYSPLTKWTDLKRTRYFATVSCKVKKVERLKTANEINEARMKQLNICLQKVYSDSERLKIKSVEMDFNEALKDECVSAKIAVKNVEKPEQLAELIEASKITCQEQ